MKWKLANKKVADLKEWHKNPRRLTEKGIKDLTTSIKKFGVAEPIVINTNNCICGGHGRKKVLQAMDIKEVACYVPNKKLTDKQMEELNIRLNKNIAGEFDMDMLANLFEYDDLIEYGFEKDELTGKEDGDFSTERGEVEFTEELLEEHNYIVLYFDNEIDWLQLETIFPLKRAKALDSKDNYEKIGIGRVVNGAEFINKITEQ